MEERVVPPEAAFRYPDRPHERRHGPAGYEAYSRYRDWLEDEFTFRCIYCLKRMVWSPTDTWTVDHLVSQSEAPELACAYDNLVLACQCCNTMKSNRRVPDPCQVAYGQCLRVEPDGSVTHLNEHGWRLVTDLRLNHPRYLTWRAQRLRDLAIMFEVAREDYLRHMGFPADLPDLSLLRPPTNKRPDGISKSWLSLQRRSLLPLTY